MLITLDWEINRVLFLQKHLDISCCINWWRKKTLFLLRHFIYQSYQELLKIELCTEDWEKNNCICQIFNFEGFLGHWYVTQSSWNARNVLGIHLWPAVEEQGGARKWKRKVLWKKYSIPDGSRRVLFHSVGSLHCSKILPRWIFRQL